MAADPEHVEAREARAPFRGLVAAPHTPFAADGSLALGVVERQAARLAGEGVGAVFVGGSTGEFASLTIDERITLAERWIPVGRAAGLRVIVHVGGTQVEAGVELARRARDADAIAGLAPHYFRPAGVDAQLAVTAKLAAGAPGLPYYHYEIPALTGITVPVVEFAARALEAVPNFVGIKFTSPDLVALQGVLDCEGLDVLFGNDEILLAALAFGVRGAVGSTYNFAPGIYQRLAAAFRVGDLEAARREQRRSVALVAVLARHGYMAAAKALMTELGVAVGPPRLPATPLSPADCAALRDELDGLGFFDWRTAAAEVASAGW